jgi:hypothetical protein
VVITQQEADEELKRLHTAEVVAAQLRSTFDNSALPVNCGHRVLPHPTLDQLDKGDVKMEEQGAVTRCKVKVTRVMHHIGDDG